MCAKEGTQLCHTLMGNATARELREGGDTTRQGDCTPSTPAAARPSTLSGGMYACLRACMCVYMYMFMFVCVCVYMGM